MSGFPQTSHAHSQADVSGLSATLAAKADGDQPALADLNLGALTLLTDTITALGTVQSRFNTLLSELRTAGVILP